MSLIDKFDFFFYKNSRYFVNPSSSQKITWGDSGIRFIKKKQKKIQIQAVYFKLKYVPADMLNNFEYYKLMKF